MMVHILSFEVSLYEESSEMISLTVGSNFRLRVLCVTELAVII